LAQVFEFHDYKRFLESALTEAKRGSRSRLAQALQCQPGYVSQILSGAAHLSPEQAEAANQFFGHNEDQSEFLLLLVLHARAGSVQLRNTFARQIERARERHLNLKTRFKVPNAVSAQAQSTFYSHWIYAAVLTAITVPALQTLPSLAEHFHLSKKKITQVLEFLVSNGLATEEKGRFQPGTLRTHLGKDSPLLSKHHINWRMQAIRSLDAEANDDLHYSSVFSASAEDLEQIRVKIVALLSELKETIRISKEEEVHSLCLDLFKI
jgi:uncharacterized protein (TIGR02147 family)